MQRNQYVYRCRSGLLLLLATSLLACSPSKNNETTAPAKPADQQLRVCSGTSYSILLAIADQKGFFAQEGLLVEMQPYALGRNAMEGMLAGKCDLATSADTPVADYGMMRDDLRVVAGIATSDRLCYLVAKKDSKIRTVADLKGRQVGVTKGTAPHFFLDMVLNRHRLQEKDVKVQFMQGDQLQQALLDGTVAAIATTDLNAYRLQEGQEEAMLLINEPGIVLNHGYLTTLDGSLIKKQEAIRRLLRGVQRAEKLVASNPDEARREFATYLKVSPQVADRVWQTLTPRLFLSPAMILTLEDNARWLREREGASPSHKSFKDIFRPQLLQSVAPESVTLH